MQPLAIRILSLALIAVSSAAAVETKYPHGGFEPRLDKLQGLLDYVRTAKKVKVKAGPTLWQTITAIPVATGVPITSEQEADLRDWLYDFLVAFSASGNDSLAAQFYLREGANNPTALQHMQETLKSWDIPQGDTPFDLFRAMHRAILDHQGYEYCFGNAFFRHSTFKVFESQRASPSPPSKKPTYAIGSTTFSWPFPLPATTASPPSSTSARASTTPRPCSTCKRP